MPCAKGCCESFAEHIQSLTFATRELPGINSRESQLRKDLDAYKRLRKDGLQPRSTQGAARVEAIADIPQQVEQPWGKLDRQTKKKVTTLASDLGLD